jgi:UDP-N-acetylbacillosamine N-acetyltransferase
MKRLIILGAGGFGRTVADIARQTNHYDTICHLDDAPGANVIGKLSEFSDIATEGSDCTEMLAAFGNNAFRLAWCKKIASAGIKLAVLVHPRAYVSPRADVGAGSVVLPMAVVNTDVRVGQGCIINCGALVDHGCVIEEGCHLCLGAIIKAENRIASLTKVEAGEVIEARTFKLN